MVTLLRKIPKQTAGYKYIWYKRRRLPSGDRNSGGNFSPEHIAHLIREIVGQKRLFQESAALQCPLPLLDDLLGVARHEKEPHRRTQRGNSSFEFKTVDPGHHEIADHQINLTGMLPEDLNGVRPIDGRQHLVPASFEG